MTNYFRVGDTVKHIPASTYGDTHHADCMEFGRLQLKKIYGDTHHADCRAGTVRSITCNDIYVQFGTACPVSVRADELILNISETT